MTEISFELTCNIRFTALLNALHFSARYIFYLCQPEYLCSSSSQNKIFAYKVSYNTVGFFGMTGKNSFPDLV